MLGGIFISIQVLIENYANYTSVNITVLKLTNHDVNLKRMHQLYNESDIKLKAQTCDLQLSPHVGIVELWILHITPVKETFDQSLMKILPVENLLNRHKIRERSGSVVECLTRDRRAAGSSLTGVTALWSLSKTHLS